MFVFFVCVCVCSIIFFNTCHSQEEPLWQFISSPVEADPLTISAICEESEITQDETELMGIVTLQASDAPCVNSNNVDIVCVVDTSGSMFGNKIELLRNSLKFLVRHIRPGDRIGLIEFNTKARVISNFRHRNDQVFDTLVDSLVANGNTDMAGGLRLAFELIRNRNEQNTVTSIILLTDGRECGGENAALDDTKYVYDTDKSVNASTLHTFGYGSDHDSKLCSEIARIGHGMFTYIEDPKTIGHSIATYLGGLKSVVAQSINLQFDVPNPNNDQVLFGDVVRFEVMTPYEMIVNTAPQTADVSVKIDIPNLYAGEQRNFVIRMKLAPKNTSQIFRTLMQITVSYTKGDDDNRVSARTELAVCRRPKGNVLNSKHVSTVRVHVFRIQTVIAIDHATKLAAEGKYDDAKTVIQNQIDTIRKSDDLNTMCTAFINDLDECKKRVDPHNWAIDQGAYLRCSSQVISQERCVGHQLNSSMVFCTASQKQEQVSYEEDEYSPIVAKRAKMVTEKDNN